MILKHGLKTIAPNGRVRVLVVDDSVVIRRLVAEALSRDIQLEVVGSASNGVIALQRIPQMKPDVITLDIEMPEKDGLQTLREIRVLYPDLPVIMFSTLTERGATATLDALSLGASDYVAKASNAGSLDKSMESLRSELIPKLKQFFRFEQSPGDPRPATPKPAVAPARVPVVRRRTGTAARVVAIGVSTGGPGALAEVMQAFPKDFHLPVVIVQHMPPVFTRLLAERLNAVSPLRVEEVTDGSRLEPGKVLLAAGGFHMRVKKRGTDVIASMDQEAPENSCRPAVDVLFRSVAEVYGSAAVGVILTGMGYDGLLGSEALKAAGAHIIAQDEQSSVVWGMPGSVVKAGLADTTVELSRVVPEILRLV